MHFLSTLLFTYPDPDFKTSANAWGWPVHVPIARDPQQRASNLVCSHRCPFRGGVASGEVPRPGLSHAQQKRLWLRLTERLCCQGEAASCPREAEEQLESERQESLGPQTPTTSVVMGQTADTTPGSHGLGKLTAAKAFSLVTVPASAMDTSCPARSPLHSLPHLSLV